MTIRQILSDDIDEVLAIEQEVFGSPLSREEIAERISQKRKYNMVGLIENGRISGYMSTWSAGKGVVALNVIAVRKDRQRQGVATRLLNSLIDSMPESGKTAISANCHESNMAIHKFLAKNGFYCRKISTAEGKNGKVTIYPFRYTVPYDNLSNNHLATLARRSRKPGKHKEGISTKSLSEKETNED